MSEDIVGQIKDIKGRTWQEAFYIQTKAFLEKNSEHLKEIAALKAEVERLTKAGDDLHAFLINYIVESRISSAYLNKLDDAWNAAKEGKGQP
jgi:hypothetical protein